MKDIHIAEAKPDKILPIKKPISGESSMRKIEAKAEDATPTMIKNL